MSSTTDVFFSEKNETVLHRVLYNDVRRRTGGDLTEKQASRLIKTVKHYMGEVYRVQGSQQSVTVLNKEVLQTVLPDYIQYLERQARGSGRSVVSDIEEGPGTQQEISGHIEDRLQMDVGAAFSRIQTSRAGPSRPVVVQQDFRLSLSEEGTMPLDVFERIKKDRDQEAQRVVLREGSLNAPPGPSIPFGQGQGQQSMVGMTVKPSQGQARFADATEMFSNNTKRAQEEEEAAFAERERRQLEMRASAGSQIVLAAPPDIRGLFMGEKKTLERTTSVPDQRSVNSRQELMITRPPDTMEYKDNEINLFVYSGDRDWTSGTEMQSRYNFSVNFDPSNMPTGLRMSPTSTVKFRNIIRIEFVKAILPGEGLDLLVSKKLLNAGTARPTYSFDSTLNMNILSYPYIQVRIPELDNNIHGTNLGLNAAFGVLQYDANWVSDTSSAQRGYLAMIPKFLKCQKVYSPTPLATLQKLSFRFERPDGTILSSAPDTLDIQHIYPSSGLASASGGLFTTDPTNYTGYSKDMNNDLSGSSYFWLRTSKLFSSWTVSKGDRIVIKNLNWDASLTGNSIQQMQDFLTYIQADSGLIVVDVGYITGTGTATVFYSGESIPKQNQGYVNAIIVRGKFPDPTADNFNIANLGIPSALGGINDSYGATDLSKFLVENPLKSGRLLNQSHQVQVALRVITREVDSTSILRPDNL